MIHWLSESTMIDDVFCPFDQCSVDCVDVMDVLVRTWSSLVARYLDRPWKVGGKGGRRAFSVYLPRPPRPCPTETELLPKRPLHFKLLGTRLSHSNLQGTRGRNCSRAVFCPWNCRARPLTLASEPSPTLRTARDKAACF
jgi:hypothetical protein